MRALPPVARRVGSQPGRVRLPRRVDPGLAGPARPGRRSSPRPAGATSAGATCPAASSPCTGPSLVARAPVVRTYDRARHLPHDPNGPPAVARWPHGDRADRPDQALRPAGSGRRDVLGGCRRRSSGSSAATVPVRARPWRAWQGCGDRTAARSGCSAATPRPPRSGLGSASSCSRQRLPDRMRVSEAMALFAVAYRRRASWRPPLERLGSGRSRAEDVRLTLRRPEAAAVRGAGPDQLAGPDVPGRDHHRPRPGGPPGDLGPRPAVEGAWRDRGDRWCALAGKEPDLAPERASEPAGRRNAPANRGGSPEPASEGMGRRAR